MVQDFRGVVRESTEAITRARALRSGFEEHLSERAEDDQGVKLGESEDGLTIEVAGLELFFRVAGRLSGKACVQLCYRERGEDDAVRVRVCREHVVDRHGNVDELQATTEAASNALATISEGFDRISRHYDDGSWCVVNGLIERDMRLGS